MANVIDSLDVLNASLLVLTQKVHDYHYYVTGPSFFTLHKTLDDYYEAIFDQVDEAAEELLKLKAKPTATYAGALALSVVKEDADKTFFDADYVKRHVLADFAAVQALIQKVHAQADAEGVYTVSALMDDFEAFYAKAGWMLSQSL